MPSIFDELLRLFPLLLTGAAVYWIALVAFTTIRLRNPPRRGYAFAVSRGVPGEPAELPDSPACLEWCLDRAGLRLPVWDITGADPAGPTLIITHGWSESRVINLGRVSAALPVVSRAVLWDMPGHGDAPGRCALGAREAADLVALAERCLGVDAAARAGSVPPLVLWGASLGSEVTLLAAAELTRRGTPPAGVIAEGAYRNGIIPARNVLREARLPVFFNLASALVATAVINRRHPLWRWRSVMDRTRDIAAPVLYLHGEADQISPIDDARAMAAARPAGRFVDIPGATHDDAWGLPGPREHAADAVRRFITGLPRPRVG